MRTSTISWVCGSNSDTVIALLESLTSSPLGLPAFLARDQMIVSDEIAELRYQLLSALGATMLEAELQKSTMAILVVHEFRTALTTDVRMDANSRALDEFLRLLFAQSGAAHERF